MTAFKETFYSYPKIIIVMRGWDYLENLWTGNLYCVSSRKRRGTASFLEEAGNPHCEVGGAPSVRAGSSLDLCGS
jgi:hypothetical protein